MESHGCHGQRMGETSRRQQSAKGELWKIRRGVTGILQTYSGESSKFYFDTTKILHPPPPRQAISNKK